MGIRLREKIGYGLGDTASSMLWKLFSVYLMFFYTDICGIDAWVVGVLFLVTRIWDSLLDPVVGLLCDRTSSRWGTFRPWLLWGALPFGALGVLTFYMPEWGTGGKVVYATVTYSLMMIVYSSVNVPYAALLGVMSADPHERTVLAAFRMTFAAAGSMAVVLAGEALVKAFRPWAGPSASWTAAVAVVAALAVVLFFVTFSTTRERVRPVRAERHPVLLSLRDLLHNRPWLILAGAAVCLQVFNAFRESGTIYFFKYCVAGETVGTVSFAGIALTGSALFLAVGPFFNIAGIVLIPFAADRFGRRRTLVGTLLLTAVFSFAFYFVRQGGYSVLLLAQALISLSVGGRGPVHGGVRHFPDRYGGLCRTAFGPPGYGADILLLFDGPEDGLGGRKCRDGVDTVAGRIRSECRPVAGCAHGYRVSAKRLPGFGRFGDMCLHSVLSAGRFPAQIMIRYAQS